MASCLDNFDSRKVSGLAHTSEPKGVLAVVQYPVGQQRQQQVQET